MIVNNGLDLICSHGDTFECSWELEGLELAEGDLITLSIKYTAGSNKIIMSRKCEHVLQQYLMSAVLINTGLTK